MKMKKYISTLLLLFSIHAYAGDKIAFQNWAVEAGAQTIEAYTANESQSSMGLFCGGNQCSFYLNSNTNCQPGTKYHVLINSAAVSTSIAMKCTQVGGRYFQILEPFDVVLNAIKSGDIIGFAMAAGPGQFVIARFSLIGASEAISLAIAETANRAKNMPKNNSPASPSTQIWDKKWVRYNHKDISSADSDCHYA